MKTQDLQNALDQFHGTETWRRHPLNKKLLHTDGVEYFAEQAGAYWFIDAIALGVYGNPGPIPAAIPDQDRFGVVLLNVSERKATIQVRSDYDENDDTCGDVLWETPIEFTDAPEGVWKFYLVDDGEHSVLMVPGEY